MYTTKMRYLYTILLYLAIPFIMLRLLWRSRHIKEYRQRWHERFGYFTALPTGKNIWLHAVSVGEIIAAIPLIKTIQQYYPQYDIIVTTTTPTGAQQVLMHLKDQVHHFYTPYDLPVNVKRFLKRTNPILCIIMETELWPNLLHVTHAHKIPIFIANARLSERSFQGYQRISRFTRTMLNKITLVAAQSKADAERFIRLGLDEEKLIIAGNIKFDLQLSKNLFAEGKSLRAHWNNRPTLIAASTHEGEEKIILNAFRTIQKKYPDTLLILVPRHPNRFSSVAQLCHSMKFNIVQRSHNQFPHANTDILLGDTLGELRLFYAAGDIAFIGGSLVPVGGHNLIEPAAMCLSIITGHHLHNFIAISQLLKDADALITVCDSQTLANSVIQLFADPKLRDAMGKRAYQVYRDNTGALQKHLEIITEKVLIFEK